MMEPTKQLLWLLTITICVQIATLIRRAALEGDACTFKDNQKGVCRLLTECFPARKALHLNGIWPLECSERSDGSLVVCCIDPESNSGSYLQQSPFRPTPTTITRSKKPGVQTEEVSSPPTSPKAGYFKIVCYYNHFSWALKDEKIKYLPEDIDADLCTHIVYTYAVLDNDTLVIKPQDSKANMDEKFYEKIVAHKKKGVKVSLAIGGWSDSKGDKYSRLVNNETARASFVTHVVEFLQKYNFDGLDLHWKYPRCWRADCTKGPSSDKAGFAAWVQELSTAFKPHGLLLSSVIPKETLLLDEGYDIPSLSENLDWISVETSDYHGSEESTTGHVSPLYHYPADDLTLSTGHFENFLELYRIHVLLNKGINRRKLVLRMAFYGLTFTLANTNETGLNAGANGPGTAGELTKDARILSYMEICDRVNNQGWTVVQDPEGRIGPYAYHDDQWVSYDDIEMVRKKSEYIRSMDLGGAMAWAPDLDDFQNRCGGGRHPLLSSIRQVLGPSIEKAKTSYY